MCEVLTVEPAALNSEPVLKTRAFDQKAGLKYGLGSWSRQLTTN